ncbi:MAG: hypothetical protein EAX86_03365 [Candidatus Heimdallarchaeota archaeon]|nr:hypothetical protein [Candidatus Heimdallarchaeota archaeon]
MNFIGGFKKSKISIKILYILIGAAIAIGIVSGIGSTCTTFDPIWWRNPSFSIIGDLQIIFIIAYIATWFTAILWIVLIWALSGGKDWFYKIALSNSVIGILGGAIPVGILLYEYWASYGNSGMRFTPSWFRTIINLVLFIVLVIPKIRTEIQNTIKSNSSAIGGSSDLGTGLAQLAFILFGFGVVMILQPFIMPATHIIDGVNVGYDFEALQFYCGLFSIVLGLITRISERIYSKIQSSRVIY